MILKQSPILRYIENKVQHCWLVRNTKEWHYLPFLFQGGLDEAERIEPAPTGYADSNQGNLSYLYEKSIAYQLVAILCLFDNSSSVTVLEMDKPSKDC